MFNYISIVEFKKNFIHGTLAEQPNSNNPTYVPAGDSCETTVKIHNQFMTLVGLEVSEKDQNTPYLYWTLKLRKSPYKHRFMAGSSMCTAKDLSFLLTKLLSTLTEGLLS